MCSRQYYSPETEFVAGIGLGEPWRPLPLWILLSDLVVAEVIYKLESHYDLLHGPLLLKAEAP